MIDKKTVLMVGLAFFLSACAAQGVSRGGAGDIASVEIKNGKIVSKNSNGRTIRPSASALLDFVGDKVYFNYNRANVQGDFDESLELQAALLNTFKGESYVIEGHADERGTSEYNLALGERRANSVRSRIVADGGDGGRVETTSFGEERPAAFGSNESAWEQNRRSVTTLGN